MVKKTNTNKPPAAMTLRAAVLLLFSMIIAGSAAVLSHAAGTPWPGAVLIGAAAFVGGWKFLDTIVGQI